MAVDTTKPTRDRRRFVESALSVLVAVLTLLSAFFGFQAATASQQRNTAQTDLSEVNARLDELAADSERLRAENGQLRSQLGLPGPSAEPSGPTVAEVRRSGQATIAVSGDALDLDSPKTNPQWVGETTDLGYNGARFSFAGYAKFLVLGTQQATYDSCRERTGFSNGGSASVDAGTVDPGDYLCVVTDEDRVAAVQILQFDAGSATFDIVVYDPPTTN